MKPLRHWRRFGAAFMLLPAMAIAAEENQECSAALDVEKRLLNSSQSVNLCEEFAGNVILVVNTASKCGFTHQYEGLEALQDNLGASGFSVLGFPSNDFGGQEPGTEQEIQEFCRLTYKVGFPMFEKTDVAEGSAGTLYRNLASLSGEYPRWNFHKYLFDRNGRLVGSYPSRTSPEQLRPIIEGLL